MSDEVRAAVEARRPVIALESTVIAHGLPRPQNLLTAQRLEEIVRAEGAIPATVAILQGTLTVGLDAEQLRHVAEHGDVHKVSRRDLPVAVARRWDGATTVATTMFIAHACGLRVFATGGIGGVHRGALPDISADLPELARTPMIVVCSGAKIVLDLAATREWLETEGVTVVGYGCDEMPAFYTRRSGLAVDVRADAPADVASLAQAQRSLGIESALVVTVPVPAADEVDETVAHDALDDALAEAGRTHVGGRELTPFLLARMSERSGGATLKANISLLENNARNAARIARALTEAE
ncbi:MAG TPA: pseudouridine-5'-phosphate glycosidase [Pyrinomonadaceae bacterium]|nr:pseudouridine-5'-phosphate glycosidase [Pyrinomonadaceae bacterium]